MFRPMMWAAAIGGVCTAPIVIGQTPVGEMSNARLIASAPPADEWREVSPVAADIRKRLLHGDLSDDDWRALLLKSGIIYTRAEWPAGRPLAIGMAYPLWLTDLLGSVSVSARLSGAKRVSTTQTWGGCALGNDGEREQRRYQEVGNLSADAREAVLEVEFRTSLDSKKPTWAGTLALPVHVVSAPDDGLVPVKDAALDAILGESLIAQVNADQGEHPTTHLWLYLQPARSGKAIGQEIGLHLTLTFLDGERVVSRLSRVEPDWRPDNVCLYGGRVDGPTPAQLSDQSFLDRLAVRVASDRDAAFRDLKRSKFWDGSFVVPIRPVLGRSAVTPTLPAGDDKAKRAAAPPAAPPPTEREKIDQMLATLARSDAIFIRNGSEYKGTDASSHLRTKLQAAGNRVKTARQFIDLLASESSASGKPYQVRTADGTTKPSREWFLKLLESLENPPPSPSPSPAP
jgi:hypothetical protein